MTPREAKRARRQLQREIAAELRRKDREALAALRAGIAGAKQQRREAVREVLAGCRHARAGLKLRALELRRQALEAIAVAIAAERHQARGRCDRAKQKARAGGTDAIRQAATALQSERQYQREIRSAVSRNRKADRPRRSTAEARAESDDAVRSNLPSELVPVFDAVKARIKEGARRSRTEAFLEWAEENPGEVVALQQRAADVELARLLKAEREHVRAMRKAGRYKASPERLARELEAVPF